ncbi:MAG: tRNA pseudouridine(38-40) synthase TruA [Ruminococcus sp.]|nr:tRNA pseudouridine(38-40) synthase TruA [Ruminococcus sp.]MBQ7133255.1 tRNA pseudouridine(38-40) synthase TruA [Ruminococcus sp.]
MQCTSASGSEIRNLKITISYSGKDLHGWQIQKNAVTVQQRFQEAVFSVLGNTPDIKGCSRTDTGVHANMYVISMKTDHQISCERLKAALNRYLPLDIVVTSVEQAPIDFHARYSCKGKRYIYKILNREVRDPFCEGYALHYRYEIDVDMLNSAAQSYVGTHDFTSFCTLDKREKGDFTRTVKSFSVYREGDFVYMSVEADGFLYNMVRIMVGTLLKIQQGKLSVDSIPDIIKAENRKEAGPTAPACGLYLDQVFY